MIALAPPGKYTDLGVAQARVLDHLREYAAGDYVTSIAERSPVGARAVRIRPTGDDGSNASNCDALARALGLRSWVERAASQPPHVYVRVTTEALREWIAADYSDHGALVAGEEDGGRRVAVRVAGSRRAPARSLDAFRQEAVGRALRASLRSRGFEVELDLDDPLEGANEGATAGSSFAGDEVLLAPVGGVDVRHGPLRARHGGTVNADDLLADFGSRPPAGAAPERYPEALLAYLLLRTERARRAVLDGEKIEREREAFDAMLAARHLAGGSPRPAPPVGAGEEGAREVRELVLELNAFPIAVARVIDALDPAFLMRFARSLANLAHGARACLPSADPLWPAVTVALDAALELAGIDIGSGRRHADLPTVEPERGGLG